MKLSGLVLLAASMTDAAPAADAAPMASPAPARVERSAAGMPAGRLGPVLSHSPIPGHE